MEVKLKKANGLVLLLLIALVVGFIMWQNGIINFNNKTAIEKNDDTLQKTDFDSLKEGETYQTTFTKDEKTGDIVISVKKVKVINYTLNDSILNVSFEQEGVNHSIMIDFSNKTLFDGEKVLNISEKQINNLKLYYVNNNCNYLLLYPIYNKEDWLLLVNNAGKCVYEGNSVSINLLGVNKEGLYNIYVNANSHVSNWNAKVDLTNLNKDEPDSCWNSLDNSWSTCHKYKDLFGSENGYNIETKEIITFLIKGATKAKTITLDSINNGYLNIKNVTLNFNVGDTIYLKGNLKGIAELGADKDYKTAYAELQFKNETAIDVFVKNIQCDKLFANEQQPTKYELECYVSNDTVFDKGNIYLKVKTYEDSKQNLFGKLTELIADLTGVDYDVWDEATLYGNQKIRILINKDQLIFKPKNAAFNGEISFEGDIYKSFKINNGQAEGNILLRYLPVFNVYYLAVS